MDELRRTQTNGYQHGRGSYPAEYEIGTDQWLALAAGSADVTAPTAEHLDRAAAVAWLDAWADAPVADPPKSLLDGYRRARERSAAADSKGENLGFKRVRTIYGSAGWAAADPVDQKIHAQMLEASASAL